MYCLSTENTEQQDLSSSVRSVFSVDLLCL